MPEYTIKDLSSILNKTEQSIYKLIKKNDALAQLIQENSREIGMGHKKLYGEPVLEWMQNHYNKKAGIIKTVESSKPDESTNIGSDATPSDKPEEIEPAESESAGESVDETDDDVESSKAGESSTNKNTAINGSNSDKDVEKPIDYRKRYKRLKKRYDELADEYDRLMSMIEIERSEKQAILKLFAMEKAEKQALLPPPKKKHWWNR